MRFKRQKHQRYYHTLALNDSYQQIDIEKVKLNISIEGDLLSTEARYTLRNTSEFDTEAYLKLPLPDGAIVNDYQLDIADNMRKAVTVDKALARQAFEDIQDRQIDPGLAEMTRGNRFTTSIYPVPAGGTRTILINSLQKLHTDAKGRVSYLYPSSLIDPGAEIDLNISLSAFRKTPTLLSHPFSRRSIKTRSNKSSLELSASISQDRNRVKLLEDLELRFYPKHTSKWFTFKEGDALYATGKTALKADQLDRLSKMDAVLLLWDSSASMASAHSENAAFIEALFKHWLKTPGSVQTLVLQEFSIAPHTASRFAVSQQGFTKLKSQLNSLIYDGASHLEAALHTLANSNADATLLFSDALISAGSDDLPSATMPLYPVVSGTETHKAVLHGL